MELGSVKEAVQVGTAYLLLVESYKYLQEALKKVPKDTEWYKTLLQKEVAIVEEMKEIECYLKSL